MTLVEKWLKSKREKLGYTQESFAKEIGIAKTTYASYEQGYRNPTVQTAKKMAKILNVSWTIFFED
ncbi:TPA: helix-turn-helix transcriptional regulator [Enterococcus faecalis]|nr:helix-turn-helix transcriptional regulator [Enterococcus faecalis]EGO8273425.1 helix-turn-helix transcriptional regulator [Enterococcus faecalis]HBI2039251.1 helix-turn-helix transcriptional regulator [Enterococcus faecalis]HBI2079824.1 helix-turn-helix transcriptional regulator [Enterococcus faecalis]HBI2108658.1 helix-turn-helix transcriptional regulator [Enterococcus faecalis]